MVRSLFVGLGENGAVTVCEVVRGENGAATAAHVVVIIVAMLNWRYLLLYDERC